MRKEILGILKAISKGVVFSLFIVCVLIILKKDVVLGQVCLYETVPHFEIGNSVRDAFSIKEDFSFKNNFAKKEEAVSTFSEKSQKEVPLNNTNGANKIFRVEKLESTEVKSYKSTLIKMKDAIFQTETSKEPVKNDFKKEEFTIENVAELRDLDVLKSKFYIVDKRTDITPEQFNVDKFLKTDVTIDNSKEGPKVLIFHTHSHEAYVGSKGSGVIAVGEALAETLSKEYGIETMHNTDVFDVVDGKPSIMGAYERMEPVIKKILEENPSIQVVIDIHRDGVSDDKKLVSVVNGKNTAKVMFFNGLCKLYEDGVLGDVESLKNPNIPTNLAFSFKAQLAANALYPDFTRKVYLHAYRFSLHMLPKSMLVEIGAQTNTEEEALNAVPPLAEIIANTILK